ncbi:MAG: hypothetical protein PHX72_03000 [Candidatus Shapirobacteria bacterium]|nr:hypothetical protein [Candidatus Shapirobacteria bacterium]
MKFIVSLVLTATLSFFNAFSPLLAQNMRSDNYEIQMGNINMTAGEKSSANFKLGDTVGQTASGLYQSTGFQVGAGFWYITGIIPFTFTISELEIAFGQLTPNNPQVLTNNLTVSAGGAGGYQVMAFENHPLKSASDNYIYDVLGDDGDIDETIASIWSQDTTYGFGFNITGDDIPDDFTNPSCDPDCYRQFADPTASPPEEPQIIMSSDDVVRQSEATVSYKINISGMQEAGHYQNQVIFIAIPKY